MTPTFMTSLTRWHMMIFPAGWQPVARAVLMLVGAVSAEAGKASSWTTGWKSSCMGGNLADQMENSPASPHPEMNIKYRSNCSQMVGISLHTWKGNLNEYLRCCCLCCRDLKAENTNALQRNLLFRLCKPFPLQRGNICPGKHHTCLTAFHEGKSANTLRSAGPRNGSTNRNPETFEIHSQLQRP